MISLTHKCEEDKARDSNSMACEALEIYAKKCKEDSPWFRINPHPFGD
jgi:hypothetical protein